MEKIIISFTTLPKRISKIKKTIDSLLNQSVKPNHIYLWLPKEFKRVKNQDITIPSFISNTPIEIKYTIDYGPFTKLRPTLEIEKDPNTIIVTADDDVLYPPNWLENLLNASKLLPDSAIGYRGRIFQNRKNLNYNQSNLYYGSYEKKYLKVDILTATWGALYKRRFFDKEIFDDNILKSSFFVDDIWINGNLAKKNIDRYIIPNINIQPVVNVANIDSLWENNRNNNNNNNMINFFKDYLK